MQVIIRPFKTKSKTRPLENQIQNYVSINPKFIEALASSKWYKSCTDWGNLHLYYSGNRIEIINEIEFLSSVEWKCNTSADHRLLGALRKTVSPAGGMGGGVIEKWMKRICPCYTPSRIALAEGARETVSIRGKLSTRFFFFFLNKRLYDIHITRFLHRERDSAPH